MVKAVVRKTLEIEGLALVVGFLLAALSKAAGVSPMFPGGYLVVGVFFTLFYHSNQGWCSPRYVYIVDVIAASFCAFLGGILYINLP